MRAARPVIGMPARMDPGRENQYLSRKYGDAILRAGGIPIIVPLSEDDGSIRSLAASLDGILLTGSDSDIDPARYGASREPRCGPAQPLRDQTDFAMLETAFEQRIPLLGICFGLQSLNVFLGGSLIQDIDAAIQTDIGHSAAESRDRLAHAVCLEPGCLLAGLSGEVAPLVNSSHHQAIDRVGLGLRVTATAPDGVIEAVELDESARWVGGVQWHPERSFATDGFSRRIFETFVAECRARREGT